MTKDLRRRHFQSWAVLALLLPAGIIASWLVIPSQPSVKLIKEEADTVLPVVMYSSGTDNFQAIIRCSNDSTEWQLEWQNKTVLTVPSAVIYKYSENEFNPATAQLVGRIETKGRYLFHLDPVSADGRPFQLALFDFIHGQKLYSIKF